jgi:GntR family transcriptional repressor for pyruvate dehydrogenase complex
MIRPATRTTLYKEVISQIVEMIKEGQWKPADRLPGELELARRFEVSRNCIREALKALGHAGILESKPGLGTFLSRDALRNIHSMELGQVVRDDTSFTELIEARLIIEPPLVRLAAERASAADVGRLEMAHRRAVRAVKAGTYSVGLGLEFHMVLVEIARNRVLMRLFQSIADELRMQRGVLILSHMSREDLLRELGEHEEILDRIKRRDGSGASALVETHLRTAARILAEARTRKDQEHSTVPEGRS